MSEHDAPWERQPAESAPAYEAFRTYREMGADRSTAKVAHQLGKSKTLMDRWSRAHAWVVRATAWDREQERLDGIELAKQRRDAAKRHVKLAQAAQNKIVARLQTLNADSLSPSDLIRWLEVSVRLERQGLGMADRVEVTEHTTPENERADLGGLTPEERRARMVLLKRELESRLNDGVDDGFAEPAGAGSGEVTRHG